MDFLGNLTGGPAPIAGGIAQIGAGALQVMDRKQQQDRAFGLQQQQMDIQQQQADRLQEAWDIQKAGFAADTKNREEWGKFLATGKVSPTVSAFYNSAKSDVNNNGVPDKQEGISPEMSMAPGAAPMGGGGGKSAKAQTWGTTALRGRPELLARGQAMVADGQTGLKQLQDHLQSLAQRDPQGAARLQASPQFQDMSRRLNFMVSEGQMMQEQHQAAQIDMAIPLGIAALRMGQFNDARKFLGGIGLNLPPIKRTRQDPKTGQFKVEFDNGSGISLSMEELQGLGSLDVPPKDRLEYMKDVMKSNMDFQGKAMDAASREKVAATHAYAPTADQKNAAEIAKWDAAYSKGIRQGKDPNSPEMKSIENRVHNLKGGAGILDAETRRAGEKAREVKGASGKTLPMWSADDARQAKQYEEIIATSTDEDEKAQAQSALNDLRSKLIPPPPKAIRREGMAPEPSWGEGESWAPSVRGMAQPVNQPRAETQARPAAPTRRIFATNPTTKQRLELVNGQWVPAK